VTAVSTGDAAASNAALTPLPHHHLSCHRRHSCWSSLTKWKSGGGGLGGGGRTTSGSGTPGGGIAAVVISARPGLATHINGASAGGEGGVPADGLWCHTSRPSGAVSPGVLTCLSSAEDGGGVPTAVAGATAAYAAAAGVASATVSSPDTPPSDTFAPGGSPEWP